MNTTLLPDPYLLEVRFIVERLFKQTVSMKCNQHKSDTMPEKALN